MVVESVHGCLTPCTQALEAGSIAGLVKRAADADLSSPEVLAVLEL